MGMGRCTYRQYYLGPVWCDIILRQKGGSHVDGDEAASCGVVASRDSHACRGWVCSVAVQATSEQ
jgi:hypothetical protein